MVVDELLVGNLRCDFLFCFVLKKKKRRFFSCCCFVSLTFGNQPLATGSHSYSVPSGSFLVFFSLFNMASCSWRSRRSCLLKSSSSSSSSLSSSSSSSSSFSRRFVGGTARAASPWAGGLGADSSSLSNSTSLTLGFLALAHASLALCLAAALARSISSLSLSSLPFSSTSDMSARLTRDNYR